MLGLFVGLVALAAVVFLVLVRSMRRRREREAWLSLAARYPASEAGVDGRRFPYPDGQGEAVVGDEGFRAHPSPALAPIEAPWGEVQSVRSGPGGGLNVRLHGGVVLLPGAASATVFSIMERRARGRAAV